MRPGPAYIIAAAVSLTIMGAIVKDLRTEMSALDAMIWRTAFSLPLMLFLARGAWRIANRRLVALRTGLGAVSMVSWFTALGGLSMLDLNLITRLQPLEIAFLAPLFLGKAETSGRFAWAMLLVGFLGCLLLLAPPEAWASPGSLVVGFATATTTSWGLWAMLSSITSAGAHLTLRSLRDEDPRAVVLWFQIGSGLLAVLALLATGALPVVPQPHQWLPLVGVGVTATLGQLFLTRAYAAERASVVAGATYIDPLLALVADAVVFAVMPKPQALLGGALVVGAGLLLLRAREAPQPPMNATVPTGAP